MAAKTLKMDYAGWVGVGPLILYSAKENKVVTRVGTGTLPALGTFEYFKKIGKNASRGGGARSLNSSVIRGAGDIDRPVVTG